MRRGSAAEASDDFGGTPGAEVDCADGASRREETNTKQTIVARHIDCAGVMHSDLIR